MAKKNSKKIRKIKKNRSWISIIILILIYSLIGFLLFIFACMMISVFVQNKANSEYDSVKYLAHLYERSVKEGKQEDVYSQLTDSGRAFLIRDTDGNVIYQQGTATLGDQKYKLATDMFVENGDDIDIGLNYSDDMYLYEDSQDDYIDVEDGTIEPDFRALFDIITMSSVGKIEIDDNVSEEEKARIVKERINEAEKPTRGIMGDNTRSTLRLPFWVSVSVNEGKEEFIAKSNINFAMQDFAVFTIFLAAVGILGTVLFITMIINIIINIVSQRRVVKLLFTDMVTNGHNKTWFLYRGEQYLRKWKTARNNYAVVNLVFMKYRTYCMCHSVEQGQILLKKVYAVLGKELDKKEMLAHEMDSNYALLLKYDDIDRLKMRVQSIILQLEKVDLEHAFSFQAGVAPVGIAKNESGRIIRRKDIDLEVIYNNACTARETMSSSDESGVAFFDDKLVEDQRWEDTVTERQRFALEHEEFIVYYQPKYDPCTDKLRGAEALIRWQNEDMGFVPPGRFIPIFEKNGFITEIDHYMLEHVAKDQKAWLDKGYKCVPVSVNISRAHFIESDLAEQIRDIVDKAGTPHEYIELELTESAFFDDKNALITTIKKLKEYGFTVSMDDFGSGYSSLNSLKDMPLDVLKLDAEFFRGKAEGDRGEIVITEAIKLAKSLNMRTVAEGVEVKEQVDFLAKQGCDMIQGYYYAKPMPKDDYVERMKAE